MSFRKLLTGTAIVLGAVLVAAPAAASAPATLRMGSVTLHACQRAIPAWCGTRSEPIDPAHPARGRFSIFFVLFTPAKPAVGTVVAEEGGPGFATTGSGPEYRALFKPLLADHNLLLVDSRGTGSSAVIRCKALQHFAGNTATAAFNNIVGACGRSLGQNSSLYATAYATHDLADIIRALHTGKVDMYGDSYGSWFVQSFASRYPGLLRSVVLDSTYSLTSIDPWYASTATTARSALRLVCERDLACTQAAGGDPWARVGALVARLRTHPISGWTRNPQGARVRATVSVRTMVDLTSDAGFDPLMYRDLDAADRAALAGVNQPLLRLAADAAQDDNSTLPAATDYSDGQYFAVACTDYPQLFDVSSPIAERPAQLEAAMAGAPAADLAPFTPHEWLTMNAYSEAFTSCLKWPEIGHPAPAAGRTPPLIPASLPVLVIGGDLDSWTPVSDAPAVLKQIGPSARLVVLRNAVHTATEGDVLTTNATRCGRSLVRSFVSAPQHLATLDTSCAAKVPPIHTPGSFPLRLSGAAPATVSSGSASVAVRRAATVATQALGDAVQTWWAETGNGGAGLYGGRFHGTEHGPDVNLTLRGARFVSDAGVSGHGVWTIASGRVSATVRVTGFNRVFAVSFSQSRALATVITAGAVLTLPAP